MNTDTLNQTTNQIKNSLQNTFSKLQTLTQNNSFYIHLALIVFIIIIVVLIIMYVNSQVTKKTTNIKYMKQDLDAIDKTIVNINNHDAIFQHNIRDYYIMSSYNSCSDGNFENGYVSLDALQNVINRGARVLDFEIYSLNNQTIIAASSTDNFFEKGTYNFLDFDSVMSAVERLAFSASTSPNFNDPLFLNFRIKSNQQHVFKDMTKSIVNNFQSRLLESKYGYEYQGENLGAEPLTNFLGKVIIMCDKSVNTGIEQSPLDELVNMASGGAFMRSMRDYDVKYTPNSQELIQYNQKNMSITMCDLSTKDNNMDAGIHFKYGCQMVCMNFQSVDSYLVFYLEYFNNSNSAFILKPEQLRYEVVYSKQPAPQNPKVSYAQRLIQKPYFNHTL